MKILIQHRHHQPAASSLALITSRLEALGALLPIEEARVLVEPGPGPEPTCRVALHLTAAGAAIRAEVIEQTESIALVKLVASLSHCLRSSLQPRIVHTPAVLTAPRR